MQSRDEQQEPSHAFKNPISNVEQLVVVSARLVSHLCFSVKGSFIVFKSRFTALEIRIVNNVGIIVSWEDSTKCLLQKNIWSTV